MNKDIRDFLIALNKVDETKRNKQFASTTAQDLSLEKKRVGQHIKPLLLSLDIDLYGTFKMHSVAQTIYNVDGWLYNKRLIFIENKCISRDWPNLFVELWMDRGTYTEPGWAKKEYKEEVKNSEVYLINAYESFVKIYDMHKIKELVSDVKVFSENRLAISVNGCRGKTYIGKDPRFGGTIYGINFPFEEVEKFEVKDFGEVVRNGRI